MQLLHSLLLESLLLDMAESARLDSFIPCQTHDNGAVRPLLLNSTSALKFMPSPYGALPVLDQLSTTCDACSKRDSPALVPASR